MIEEFVRSIPEPIAEAWRDYARQYGKDGEFVRPESLARYVIGCWAAGFEFEASDIEDLVTAAGLHPANEDHILDEVFAIIATLKVLEEDHEGKVPNNDRT